MTTPKTEAGRALLDLIDVTFQNLDEHREASPDRETAAQRILAIEAEAVKPWREAVQALLFEPPFDFPTDPRDSIKRADAARALLATPPGESGE